MLTKPREATSFPTAKGAERASYTALTSHCEADRTIVVQDMSDLTYKIRLDDARGRTLGYWRDAERERQMTSQEFRARARELAEHHRRVNLFRANVREWRNTNFGNTRDKFIVWKHPE